MPSAVLKGSDCPARQVAAQAGTAIVELSVETQDAPGFDLSVTPSYSIATPAEPGSDSVAFILLTSGTTSAPKLIPFSHHNMLSAAARLRAWFKLTPLDRCLCASPIYYSHGLKVTLFTPLLTGGTVAFPTNASKIECSEWFGSLAPTWYSAGPTLHRMVLDKAQLSRGPGFAHSLRFILSGGATLPRNILEELQEIFGVPVVEHYGLSECAQIAANLPFPGAYKIGTCGIPWPGTLAITREDGQPASSGEPGQIMVRGPTVISGYLDSPDLNRTSFVNGWFKTGDIGSIDVDGFLWLHGREKEVINRGGEKIWPSEIDDVLMGHPAVAEAATFAMPHPRLGEDVAAAVVLAQGENARPIDLRKYLSDRLASFKVPRQLFIVDRLPKGSTGKVLRRSLRDSLIQDESISIPASDLHQNLVPSSLIEVWSRLLKYSPVGIDDDFFEKGGDSLLAMELLAELDQLSGRKVSPSILFEASTIGQIALALSEQDKLSERRIHQLSPQGRRIPLVFFHGDPGGGGNYVKRVAAALGSDQPIFAVQPHGARNEPVPHSIEAMALYLLPPIIMAQPQGPYRLCGYCTSGLVAFEVARLLVAAGKQVDMVIIIDLPTANARRSVQMLASIINRLRPTEGSSIELAGARIWYLLTKIDTFLRHAPSKRLVKAKAFIGSLRRKKSSPAPIDPGGNEIYVPKPFGYYHFWKYSIAMSRYRPILFASQSRAFFRGL